MYDAFECDLARDGRHDRLRFVSQGFSTGVQERLGVLQQLPGTPYALGGLFQCITPQDDAVAQILTDINHHVFVRQLCPCFNLVFC